MADSSVTGKAGFSSIRWSLALSGLSMTAVLAFSGPVPSYAQTVKAGLNPAQIERLTGAKGMFDAKEGVFKVNVPRNDLKVTVAGVKMIPALGLTSYAAFKHTGRGDVVMGDITMTEDQVNPVMSAALNNGLSVTGLHNHFFFDRPKVMFMHIEGMGSEMKLAAAVGKVFAEEKATRGGKGLVPTAHINPAQTHLDTRRIDAIIGQHGKMDHGIYKVTIGRTATMHGVTVGNAMGVNTWAAFAGTDGKAIVDGDFAMHENELQNVLKAMRRANINVVALHQHMTMETPRILFLHYWGVGPADRLARGVKSALNQTSAKVKGG